MSQPHEPRPRERSAFAAAFLSLLFPGLGHAYAGAWRRAIGFAAPPVLLLALAGGTVLAFGEDLLGFVLQPAILTVGLVFNIVAYIYRIVAAIDAWRVVSFVNRYEGRAPRGPVLPAFGMLSVAGLVAICLVMGGAHAAIAYYDSQALDLITGIYTTDDDEPFATPDASSDAEATVPPHSIAPGSAAPTIDPAETEPPESAVWNEKEVLNLLIIGSDKRPKEGTWNTDTLLVLSIDPQTRQVAMFTLPRDITDVPLPPSVARNMGTNVWNQHKINQLFMYAKNVGKNKGIKDYGYKALKQTLGYLYGITIQYYVEVDFNGFEDVVDALGGVTINVQAPVVDDNYPGKGGRIRVYIPTGVQHMTGAQALIYARSRHGSNDFDRGARQQRVILSLRQQADFSTLMRPEVLEKLVAAGKKSLQTDFPIDKIPAALELAQRVDIQDVRSYVFGPTLYATDWWPINRTSIVTPKIPAIRQAVKNAFKFKTSDEEEQAAFKDENATVWVLDGTGQANASDIAANLAFRGINASSPNVKTPAVTGKDTTIICYNGVELGATRTVARLEKIFGVQVKAVTDAAAKADIIIVTADRTPNLKAPTLGN